MPFLTRMFGFLSLLVLALSLVAGPAEAQDDSGLRTVEYETTEVTQASVAVSPDGQWVIFTMVGHLFRLPVEGGNSGSWKFSTQSA